VLGPELPGLDLVLLQEALLLQVWLELAPEGQELGLEVGPGLLGLDLVLLQEALLLQVWLELAPEGQGQGQGQWQAVELELIFALWRLKDAQ